MVTLKRSWIGHLETHAVHQDGAAEVGKTAA